MPELANRIFPGQLQSLSLRWAWQFERATWWPSASTSTLESILHLPWLPSRYLQDGFLFAPIIEAEEGYAAEVYGLKK